MNELLNNIDQVQTEIEILEKNDLIEKYNALLLEKNQIIVAIKEEIKNGNTIDESETLVFKKSIRKSYNVEKFKALAGELAKNYIKVEEKISTTEVKKAIKKGDLPEDITKAEEINSVSITVIPKSTILTEINL